ncbi:MAG: 3-deoxy-D-manno-octulosonic acid transferase [Comamonadaceae bacterium]|nr:MAG: 3-deoxy-D-manno-octulosonic acid transferase [Comamonadaceae bacterium]
MMLGLYSWLMGMAQPLLRRKLKRRGVDEPGYLDAIEERFGMYGPDTAFTADAPVGEGFVWLHAVSLGETRAAAIFIERLREALPGMRLLLTHGTATGRAEGRKLLKPGDVQAWLPWDTAPVVARFLAHFKPRIGVLMETEVWPQLVASCKARGVPLVLANGRLSEKSLAQAQRLDWLSRPAYRSLAGVWAQTPDDAARFRELDARVLGIYGNLKFDATPDPRLLAQGKAWRAASVRPVAMIASSREGEEKLLLDEIRGLAGSGSSSSRAVQWLIVPRHPQRFEEVAQLIAEQGFSVVRRSASDGSLPPADVWLGDSLGEMALYYGLADVALLGGSFLPLGGQNLIEAAACGCPVIMGPSTFNFAEAADLALEAGAAVRVGDMGEGVTASVALAADASKQQAAAKAALRFAGEHRGAARKTALAVAAMLAPEPPGGSDADISGSAPHSRRTGLRA